MTNINSEKLNLLARESGFDAIGWTSDFAPSQANYFQSWLKKKHHGEMGFLERNLDKRLSPDQIQPDTHTILVLLHSYNHDQGQKKSFKVARYAQGEDYHIWIKAKLESLAIRIRDELDENFTWRSFVDTGPLLERDLAAKAGLGWIGKNTCLINEDLGSFVFLSVILCNLNLANPEISTDQCATCRLCLDACPTQALDEYQINASKCLAYHNIERRGERDASYWSSLGDHLVGCDICQEICPWNRNVPQTTNQKWLDSFANHQIMDLRELLTMTRSEYRRKYKSSALSRIRYDDMIRNVAIVAMNTHRSDLVPDLVQWQKLNSDLSLIEINQAILRLTKH